jgi:murein DD-endopeptidase MepM/ murein hydrolase activator NlpD
MSSTQTAGAAVHRVTRQKRVRLAAILSVFGVLATASLVATTAPPAYATSYPSWNDVVAARNNQAAAAAQVQQITALIASLDAQVASTQADAAAKGQASQEAEQKYFEADLKQQQLQAQAQAASAAAKKSKNEVGQYAAQLARSGGSNGGVTLNLLLNGSKAGTFLDSMGTAGKASERANDIYKKAVLDQNTAQALTDQATVQSKILKGLKEAAAAAFDVAQKAATAAQTALDAQTEHKKALQIQLAALTTARNMTETQYEVGVEAALAASAGAPAGRVNSAGWAKPTIGVITAGYGYRNDPAAGGAWRLHTGTDLAHGCNVPVYAAHSGRVVYAGPNGTLGNWILIDDGDGFQTGYGHIINGGILVRIGQQVAGGQNIARTGETGGATGCHLHFETRVQGIPTNAVPFMRARGITLG